MDFVEPGLATATDIQLVVQHLARRPDVVAGQTVVVGHSGGGWGALAMASRQPPGVIGYLNISGGHGSRRGTPDGACGPTPLLRAARTFGRTAQTPSLWIYADNDSHIGPRLARALFDAYTAAGGVAQMHMVRSFEDEGHNIFDEDGIELWGAAVSTWLEGLARRP
jgi:pimeloyl-ACP methyl ester carboxylesterase